MSDLTKNWLEINGLMSAVSDVFPLEREVESDRDFGVGTRDHENAELTTEYCQVDGCHRVASTECRCGAFLCDVHERDCPNDDRGGLHG